MKWIGHISLQNLQKQHFTEQQATQLPSLKEEYDLLSHLKAEFILHRTRQKYHFESERPSHLLALRLKECESKGVFTPVDRLLYSETGIQIITMLLFILGAVCFHTAKFLNGPKLSRASKLSSHWSKFHGAGMTINDSFGKRGKQTLSHTHTHTHTRVRMERQQL